MDHRELRKMLWKKAYKTKAPRKSFYRLVKEHGLCHKNSCPNDNEGYTFCAECRVKEAVRVGAYRKKLKTYYEEMRK